jgi:hypothetical protein
MGSQQRGWVIRVIGRHFPLALHHLRCAATETCQERETERERERENRRTGNVVLLDDPFGGLLDGGGGSGGRLGLL